VSAGDAHAYTEADELLHPVTDHPLWQESVLLHWFDRTRGVGGWHRLGHEPNNQGGRAAIWSWIFSAADGWQYRSCTDVPLEPGDRGATGHGAGRALRFSYQGGVAHWHIADQGIEAELECRNFYPILDPFPPSDALAKARFSRHFETAGEVRGYVLREGRRIEIRGYGYRDHSWGPRDWNHGMPNHRWFTGTLDGRMSFAAITAQAPSGNITRVGYVHRDGRVIHATAVDVVAHIEPDGLTHRGGELTLTLPGDEKFHVDFRARAGVLFQRGNVVMAEILCEARGHGLSGYLDAEMSSNPRQGSGPVLAAINATTADGIAPFRLMDFAF
jgi:hypothetical protein